MHRQWVGFSMWLVALLLLVSGAEAQVRAGDELSVREPGRIGIAFSVDDSEELRIDRVLQGTPAARAGLREGDVIIRWNGRTDVRTAIMELALQPGDTVVVRVRRETERDRDITLVSEELTRSVGQRTRRPADGEVIVIRPGEARQHFQIIRDSLVVHADSLRSRIRVLLQDSLGPRLEELERSGRFHVIRVDSILAANRGLGLADDLAIGRGGVAGAELTDLSDGLAGYFAADDGALVLRVPPETPAARAGLREGDVIIRAGGQTVARVSDVRRAVAAADGGDVEIEVVRRGNRHILVLSR